MFGGDSVETLLWPQIMCLLRALIGSDDGQSNVVEFQGWSSVPVLSLLPTRL